MEAKKNRENRGCVERKMGRDLLVEGGGLGEGKEEGSGAGARALAACCPAFSSGKERGQVEVTTKGGGGGTGWFEWGCRWAGPLGLTCLPLVCFLFFLLFFCKRERERARGFGV